MAGDIATDLAFGQITPDTCETLRAVWPLVEAAMAPILDRMYAHIARRPELKAMFANEEVIKSARQRQHRHWARLFSGTFDPDYVASLRRIAMTHAQIGLEPSFYIGAYLVALEDIHALLVTALVKRVTTGSARATLERSIRAVDRAVLFDLSQVVSGYLQENGENFRKRMDEVADQFGAAINKFTGDIATAAHGLHTSSEDMLSAADTVTHEVAGLTAGAEQSSANMQTVASAAEEITASISEISRQTQQAADNTTAAVATVRRAAEIVESLNATAAKIGDVVALIQNIAGQTNLLALNATIEAARAGDAGKGFAVVAGEVKALSAQTARATDDIREQVTAVRGVVTQIAGTMGEITRAVDRVRESTASIAGAVEQQGAATQEIARSVGSAASGAAEITGGARNVGTVATRAANSAREVAAASADLTRQSNTLTQESAAFIEKIRKTDRRREARSDARTDVTLEIQGTDQAGVLANISAGGAAVRTDTSRLGRERPDVVLRMDGSPIRARMRIVNVAGTLLSLAFRDPAEGEAAARWFTSRPASNPRAA
jgi:methyl-accepting chemotaxis protein